MAEPRPAVPPAPLDPEAAAAKRKRERRPFWWAFGVMFGAMAIAAVVAYATAGSSGDPNPTAQANAAQGQSIPEPGSGHKPTGPGDRGGWEQLSLLGVIVVGVVGLGVLAWRSATRTRAGRQQWLDAAARGREDQVGAPPSAARTADPSRAPPT
jgi:hypothetical protein